MAKLWKLKSSIPKNIADNLGEYPSFFSQLLYNRGLTDPSEIKTFLQPKYEQLHSPFLFKDMKKAVERIWQAVNAKEKICIYGDYDADAVTANAVLQQTFRSLGVSVESYIPDRFSEGYGINMQALESIRDAGSKLIITVDCGTNSTDAAEFCKLNNIDLIITDHHEIVADLPQAYALINPKNPDGGYPYAEITGVGVAFKLACAILQDPQSTALNPKIVPGFEKWLLDLVAIGTVADCHSLLGENRILVKYGLKVLAKTKWAGLRALCESAGLDFQAKPPDSYALGFVIAPRLNAAGRLEHANIALDLLLEQDMAAGKQKAEALNVINQRRQQLTQTVLSEAKEQAVLLGERKVLALVGEGWPKGVVGLVAGKLAQEFYKPVVVLERTADFCTGSARTAGEFNLIEALKFSSEHLVKFGGHKQAAGLSLDAGQFDFFYQKLLLFAETNINIENTEKVLELDAELEERELSIVNCQLLQLLEPFGVDNKAPKFLISGLTILSSRVVGSSGQHSQYRLKKNSATVAAIAFNSGSFEKIFKPGNIVDVACELTEDSWNNNSQVKLKIVDMRPQTN